MRSGDWTTRHSVSTMARRTAALINELLGERPDPQAVVGVLRDYGELDPIDVDEADVTAMRDVAERLREVFAATDVDEAAGTLNRLLGEHPATLRLTSHAGRTPWHPHLDTSDDAPLGEWFLASSCLALTVLVWDRQRPPGGLCASPRCSNVYLAIGQGPERHYCSRRCATRERVAAHRSARSSTSRGRGRPT